MQIFACEPTTEAILPFVKAFAGLLRRRPFLVQRLETVVTKLLTSLDFFDDAGHKQIAIGMHPDSRAFMLDIYHPRAW